MGPVWRTIILVMVSRRQVLLFAALLCGGLSICLVSAEEQSTGEEDNNFTVSSIFSFPHMVVEFWKYCFSPQLPKDAQSEATNSSDRDQDTCNQR